MLSASRTSKAVWGSRRDRYLVWLFISYRNLDFFSYRGEYATPGRLLYVGMPPPVLAVPFGQPGAATRVRPGTVHASVQIFDFFLTQQ